MSEKKIRISVDDDASAKMARIGSNTEKAMQGVTDSYSEMDDVIEGLIKDSEKYTNSIKDRISWIEREIKAQERDSKNFHYERKQKLDHEKRLGQEKRQWHKEDENMYRRRKSNADAERRDEHVYYERLKQRFQEKKAGFHSGAKPGFTDRVNQYLQEASMLDRASGKKANDEDDDGSGSRGGRRSRIVNSGRTVGNAALSAVGFGAVLSLAGFVGKMIDEGRSLDENRNRLSGTTGGSSVSGAAFGLKESSFMEFVRNVSISRGISSSSEARDQLALEKGFGLDIGSTNEYNKVLRASDSTLVDATVEMLNIMEKSDLYNIKRGDFSQLHELMSRANTLNEMQASHNETVEAYKSSAIMAALGKVGGSFGDFRQAATIQSINQSITNPNNDFKQAFLFRALRQQDPSASFLDLKMRQEEGIFGQGTLGGVMKNLSSTFQGDQLTFSISKMLGLNLHQSKKLQQHFASNQNMFDGMSFKNEEEFKAFAEGGFSRESITKRGASKTGTIERWVSKFDTKMGRAGDKAVKYVEELEGAYDKGGFSGMAAKLGSDIVEAIKDGFKAALGFGSGNSAETGQTMEMWKTGQFIDYTEGGKVKKGPRLTSQYNAMKHGADLRAALQQVPQSELERYQLVNENTPLGGDRVFHGVQIDPSQQSKNTGKAKDFNNLALELLNKYGSGTFKQGDNGEIIKVEVVNQKQSQPQNNAYKPTSDN